MNFSAFQIGGRLVRDPEIKDARGTVVCQFAIAVNRKSKGEDVPSFFDCVIFGDQATNFAKYHSKGDLAFVVGEPEQQRWEKDGQKRSRIVFKAFRWTFVGAKSDREQSRETSPPQQRQQGSMYGGGDSGYGDTGGSYNDPNDTPF